MANYGDLNQAQPVYTFDLTTNAPLAIPGTDPLAVNRPQAAGVDLPSYVSQAFYISISSIGDELIGDFGVIFKTAGGIVIDTITASFNYRDRAVSPDPQFVFTSSGVVFANQPVVSYASNGATAGGGGLNNNAFVTSPVYRIDLPFGATATPSVTITSVSSDVRMDMTLIAIPNSIASLSQSLVLTARKTFLNNISGNYWVWPNSNFNGTTLYTVAAWDAYWFDGVEWQHATSAPGGDTASFQTTYNDIGTLRAYVRVTQADGLIGWAVSTGNVSAKLTMGVVLMPDGARISASQSGANVVICRFAKDSAVSLPLATLTGLTRARITARNGVLTLLARVTATGNFETRQSTNGGTTWQ